MCTRLQSSKSNQIAYFHKSLFSSTFKGSKLKIKENKNKKKQKRNKKNTSKKMHSKNDK